MFIHVYIYSDLFFFSTEITCVYDHPSIWIFTYFCCGTSFTTIQLFLISVVSPPILVCYHEIPRERQKERGGRKRKRSKEGQWLGNGFVYRFQYSLTLKYRLLLSCKVKVKGREGVVRG